jgi:hypothetical protein
VVNFGYTSTILNAKLSGYVLGVGEVSLRRGKGVCATRQLAGLDARTEGGIVKTRRWFVSGRVVGTKGQWNSEVPAAYQGW